MTTTYRELGVDKPTIVYAALAAMFTGSLVSSNYLASKLVAGSIFGVSVGVPAAVVAYAMTFMFAALINEIYGRRAAAIAVAVGFSTQILVLAYNALALMFPHAPFSPASPEAYKAVVGGSLPIILASLSAYVASQAHDVWAFSFWKRVTGGRWLWFRNTVSTAVSQLIDTVVFISLAFNVLPGFMGLEVVPWSTIYGIILGQYTVKWLIAVADNPLVYLGKHIVVKYLGPASIRAPVSGEGKRVGAA